MVIFFDASSLVTSHYARTAVVLVSASRISYPPVDHFLARLVCAFFWEPSGASIIQEKLLLQRKIMIRNFMCRTFLISPL